MNEQLFLERKTFRWSFSQWENYNQCPARWKFKSVLKVPARPAGPAAARGSDLHSRVERYIKDGVPVETPIVTPELDSQAASLYRARAQERGPAWEQLGDATKDVWREEARGFKPASVSWKYRHVLDNFRNHPNGAVYLEHRVAFDEEWHLCSPIEPQASVIMIMDAVRAGGAWEGPDKGKDDGVVWVAEWKSGKPKDTHPDQRKLYALGALKKFMAHKVEVTTYYLEDTSPPQRFSAEAKNIPRLIEIWDERKGLMQKDEICAPRPGDYCIWCDYAKAKGGPCQFG